MGAHSILADGQRSHDSIQPRENPMISRIRRILLSFYLVGLALVLAGTFAPAQSAVAATSYVVNDAGADCSPYVATHTVIQDAVDDTFVNGVKTILICPGTYSHFAINGANKLTIKAALPGTYPIVLNVHTYPYTNALVVDSSGVVLDGLYFDGDNFSSNFDIVAGIRFENASGVVQNSIITRVRCIPIPCNGGYGILLLDYNDDGKQSVLSIKNVNITDFDAVGISVEGSAKLTASKVRVSGDFTGGEYVVGTGIHFTFGATGSVKDSTISDVYNGVVLLGGISKATFSGNTIAGVETGLLLSAFCYPASEISSSNKIVGNTFIEVHGQGVTIQNPGIGCSYTSKNTISGNTFNGASGSTNGIFFDVGSGASADKNVITSNIFYGFADEITEDPDATNTKVSGNIWLP
jgi:hypothetical protein